MTSHKNSVYCAIDDKYVVPYLVSIYSAAENTEAPVSELKFHLAYYSNSLSQPSIELLVGVAKALSVDFRLFCLDEFGEQESIGQYPGLVFAKFLIADVIAEDFVWVDADTLLLVGWDQVFQSDPSQSLAAVSGVQDSWVAANLDKFKNNLSVTQAFIDGTRYLNAGVLQVRSLIWQERYSQEWKPVAKQARQLGFSMGEQDVLNHLVKGDSGKINETLNRIVDPRSKYEPPIGIWHFAGGWKPWGRSTQLRFPGKRAAQLWTLFAKRLSRELFEHDSGIGENFLNRWQLLQSNSNQKISLRFPKNLIYWILDRLVRDPSLGRR